MERYCTDKITYRRSISDKVNYKFTFVSDIIEFFQNVFNSVTKIFFVNVKTLFEPGTSVARDRSVTTEPLIHRQQRRFLNWYESMLQWFIRFPELAEFTEFPFYLGKTPLWTLVIVKYIVRSTEPINLTITRDSLNH